MNSTVLPKPKKLNWRRGDLAQKEKNHHTKIRPPRSPFVKCSELWLFLFRSGQRRKEYNVYLPDSSLFHIYDEVHQGSVCGHPERQIVGREKNLRKELSNSTSHPRFLICNGVIAKL